ncbi:MAG: type II toxin-antitoxin system VapC family toxin [Aeromicrobium sp.]|uniref:type II toxin-antitoxin system VapC family toxin n=1 Tax=Aeromicrobium sp. TaxID=1871063 RepID=UPI0039E68564
MSLRYLLDTNILIFLLRRRDEVLRPRLVANEGRLAVSTVSVMELFYGVERSRDPRQARLGVESLLAQVDVLDMDARAAEHAAEIRAGLASAGTSIGSYDVLIAGHARSAGLTVVTNNRREFDRVPGLVVEDWTQYE